MDAGDDDNEFVCGSCRKSGSLICCEGCPAAFHARCAGYGKPGAAAAPACSSSSARARLRQQRTSGCSSCLLTASQTRPQTCRTATSSAGSAPPSAPASSTRLRRSGRPSRARCQCCWPLMTPLSCFTGAAAPSAHRCAPAASGVRTPVCCIPCGAAVPGPRAAATHAGASCCPCLMATWSWRTWTLW